MTEYVPLYLDGDEITRQASAAVTGGQLLEVSGSGTVAPAGAGSKKVLGVAAVDAVSGDPLTVFCEGVHKLTASGAISAGALVIAGASGTVATIGAGTFDQVVGLALTTAADGAAVEVQLRT